VGGAEGRRRISKDADSRTRKADVDRMELLSRDGDEAVASGDRVGLATRVAPLCSAAIAVCRRRTPSEAHVFIKRRGAPCGVSFRPRVSAAVHALIRST
jgi:hypothetical protein